MTTRDKLQCASLAPANPQLFSDVVKTFLIRHNDRHGGPRGLNFVVFDLSRPDLGSGLGLECMAQSWPKLKNGGHHCFLLDHVSACNSLCERWFYIFKVYCNRGTQSLWSMGTPESYNNPGWIRCQNGARVGKISIFNFTLHTPARLSAVQLF